MGGQITTSGFCFFFGFSIKNSGCQSPSGAIFTNRSDNIRHLGQLSKVCSANVPSKAIIVVTIQHSHLIAWGDIFNLLTLFQNRNPLQMKHWGLLSVLWSSHLLCRVSIGSSLSWKQFFALYTQKKHHEPLIFGHFFPLNCFDCAAFLRFCQACFELSPLVIYVGHCMYALEKVNKNTTSNKKVETVRKVSNCCECVHAWTSYKLSLWDTHNRIILITITKVSWQVAAETWTTWWENTTMMNNDE